MPPFLSSGCRRPLRQRRSLPKCSRGRSASARQPPSTARRKRPPVKSKCYLGIDGQSFLQDLPGLGKSEPIRIQNERGDKISIG